MIKQLRIPASWPFYLAGIPVFFVWHKLNENYGLIPFSVAARLTLLYWGILAILFAFWLLALYSAKNKSRARVWRTAGLMAGISGVIYLFWGAIHDFLKTGSIPHFLSSYGFLFTLIPLLLIAGLIMLRKRKPELIQLTRFLNLLLLFLVGMEAALSLFYLSTGKKEKGQLSYQLSPALNHPLPAGINKDSLPDIFLIIWDEYASSPSLQENQLFNNNQLEQLLQARGYYIADASMSNYNSTPHSLASMLNLDYFPVALENAPSDPPGMLRAQEALGNALLPQWLAQQGYTIVNLGLMDLPGQPAPYESFFNRDLQNTLLHENLPARVRAEIWWKIVTWFPFLNWSRNDWKEKQKESIEVFRHNWNGLQTAWQATSPQPKMVFAHFMMPHIPFHFNRMGQRRDLGSLDRSSMRDSLYIDQLLYVNTLIDSLTSTPYDSNARSRVVVIMGDHGFRDNDLHPAKRKRKKQFENLTAIYYSDQNYQQLYPSISPINNARVLANKYFGYQLPLLPDSTIMLR